MSNRAARCGFAVLARLGIVACLAGSLAGCVDMEAPSADTTASIRPANMPRRDGVNPGGTSLAPFTVVGAPTGIHEQLQALYDSEAKRQNLTFADAKSANYSVRGYVKAVPQGPETAVAVVLDVFDNHHQHVQRIEDQVTVKAAAADPWAAVDQTALAAVAAKSAGDLANFLTNTPEAVAVAEGRTTAPRPTAEGQTTVVATQPAPLPPTRGAGFASLH
jgi:hypothetical protein